MWGYLEFCAISDRNSDQKLKRKQTNVALFLNSNFLKLTIFWVPVLDAKMYVSFLGFGPLSQKISLNCFAFDL